MFRKRRRATPHFKIPPPYNPIAGEQANLRQDGLSPFCAMMQIAADDIYANHVICRGFDLRILRFIDYVAGDPLKPGISVAKPFGKRLVGTYEIGEVYPAFLPTQGNTEFSGFRQVTFVPPSPTSADWRVGQNPGVVTGGLEGGQPSSLGDEIAILYDHNGKVVNWLLIDSRGDGGVSSNVGDSIRFRVVDCICSGGVLEYITVEWTHYTGGCSEPPGVDPYTGLIDVYDTCVLGYYTVDFLTSGEATGRATYFYSRDYCEPLWLVDSICGAPECG